MKKLIVAAALALSLALPGISEARGFAFHGGGGGFHGGGWHGGGWGYRGGWHGGWGGYRGGWGGWGWGWPFVAGAALGAAVAYDSYYPYPYYYAPPAYYYAPPPAYYPPPAAPAPGY